MARPLRRMLASRLLWSAAAVAYGAALWVFALYFFAHLVTGNKPLPGLYGITSVALWGQIIYARVAAWVMEARGAVMSLRMTPAVVPPE